MIPPDLSSALLNHLWQSTLFGGIAALLVLALRKNHAALRYRIWLIASVKFLVPFSLLVTIGSHLGWSNAASIPQAGISTAVEEVTQPFTAYAGITPVPLRPRLDAAISIHSILFAIWACGFIAVAFSWRRRWQHVRTVVRAGSPLAFEANIPVLSSPVLLEPGVFGIFRPVLLLPEGIVDRLAPAHLAAIIAHELCHVRRRDNLAAAIHMAVEAIFWFHPLVWWIGMRLLEERERACDEEVLRLGNEPEIYAESILRTCRLYVESPLVCVSGITGSDLKKRIIRIMTQRVSRKLDFGRKLLLAAVSMAAVAGPIVFGIVNAPPSSAQSQAGTPANAPSFEVASVKPDKSGNNGSHWRGNDSAGKITAVNISLRDIVKYAYGVRDYQISGPDWIKSERYDIAVEAAGPTKQEELERMMQMLLAERFKLALHREEKVLPVYALVVAKSGLKVKAVQSDGHTSSNSTRGHLTSQNASMSKFAEVLSRHTDRPVVDQTGVKGAYDFKLEWTPDDKPSRPPEQADGIVTNETSAPSIFTALQEQLGLKLEARKAPVDILVIDHAEKVPTEN